MASHLISLFEKNKRNESNHSNNPQNTPSGKQYWSKRSPKLALFQDLLLHICSRSSFSVSISISSLSSSVPLSITLILDEDYHHIMSSVCQSSNVQNKRLCCKKEMRTKKGKSLVPVRHSCQLKLPLCTVPYLLRGKRENYFNVSGSIWVRL